MHASIFRRLRWVLALLLLLAVGIGVSFVGVPVYQWWTGFGRLTFGFSLNEPVDWRAVELRAELLREKPRCIDETIAALRKFNRKVTMLSTWMLITSSQAEYVEPRLMAVANSQQESLISKVLALHVLWVRTGDLAYLEQHFELVRAPGSLDVTLGRSLLSNSFDVEELVKFGKLSLWGDEPMPASTAEFREFIRKSNAVVRIKDPEKLRLYMPEEELRSEEQTSFVPFSSPLYQSWQRTNVFCKPSEPARSLDPIRPDGQVDLQGGGFITRP